MSHKRDASDTRMRATFGKTCVNGPWSRSRLCRIVIILINSRVEEASSCPIYGPARWTWNARISSSRSFSNPPSTAGPVFSLSVSSYFLFLSFSFSFFFFLFFFYLTILVTVRGRADTADRGTLSRWAGVVPRF